MSVANRITAAPVNPLSERQALIKLTLENMDCSITEFCWDTGFGPGQLWNYYTGRIEPFQSTVDRILGEVNHAV